MIRAIRFRLRRRRRTRLQHCGPVSLSRMPPKREQLLYPRSRWHWKGITGGLGVAGSEVSGAVSITATFTGKAPSGPDSNGPSFGIVRLAPGVTDPAASGRRRQRQWGDLNALTPYARLFPSSAAAPATVQTVLTPGNYVALNDTKRRSSRVLRFHRDPIHIRPQRCRARRPPPKRRRVRLPEPSVLHDGTIVRLFPTGSSCT